MHETNHSQWLAFEELAKAYPNDNGVRLTADLARWLVEERQRQQLPALPILQKVVRTLIQELYFTTVEAFQGDSPTHEAGVPISNAEGTTNRIEKK